ncbi:DUF1659 domain-containing protein [Clostridium ganghwense]|uniref:DUF1659 domain-containing protein n=1 Tax=Clostridium ganghwense TaxID=312089 RepID=A0ABT4CSQ9_9CLOT|nr:DUF1659 domain-containing protein [Clostridium ganghwense]MCY6371231.1 DUF1659 domain-containing protein [Clostridium ganghwense]
MAKSALIKSDVAIKYHFGQDDKGKELYKKQRLTKLKPTATDDEVFAVATAVSKFLEDPITEIYKENENLLTEM